VGLKNKRHFYPSLLWLTEIPLILFVITISQGPFALFFLLVARLHAAASVSHLYTVISST